MTELMRTAGGTTFAVKLTENTPEDVPIWDVNGLWKEWNYDEIYRGRQFIGEGNKGRYVPKVDDKVFRKGVGTYICTEVNPTTLLSVLIPYKEPDTSGADEKDFLLGVGPRQPQEGYFVYIDDTTIPARMSFDAMACFYQPETRYIRVFAGSNAAAVPEVVSAWYNASGEYVDDKIPLTKINSIPENGVDTLGYWVPKVGWAKRVIDEGEVVTLVGYNDAGREVSNSVWMVRHGASYRESNSGAREVHSVELISPYLSKDVPNQLVVPVGTTLNSIAMMCRVVYTNGTPVERSIDGGKIILSGMDGWVASQPGIDYPMNLFYKLDHTESYAGAMGGPNNTIRVPYVVRTDSSVNAYGMKIFTYPQWVSPNRGYKLRHFLQSIDRDQVYEVTDLVEIGVNSAPWDGLLYGSKQRMEFSLDISRVDPRFVSYRHTQTTWISLLTDGLNDSRDNWIIQYEPGQSPAYGYNLRCRLNFVSSQVWGCDISCGYTNQKDWIDALYRNTKPLYAIDYETGPLEPTHFVLYVENLRYRRPISDWNRGFTVETGSHNGELAVIHWVREVNGVDLQLATSGLIIHQQVA